MSYKSKETLLCVQKAQIRIVLAIWKPSNKSCLRKLLCCRIRWLWMLWANYGGLVLSKLAFKAWKTNFLLSKRLHVRKLKCCNNYWLLEEKVRLIDSACLNVWEGKFSLHILWHLNIHFILLWPKLSTHVFGVWSLRRSFKIEISDWLLHHSINIQSWI